MFLKTFEEGGLFAFSLYLSLFLFLSLILSLTFSRGFQARKIQNLGAIAYSLCSFGEEPFDISVIKGGWLLRITTMDVNANSTSMDFWSAVASFKNGKELLILQTQLLSQF